MALGVIGAIAEAIMVGPEGQDYAAMSIAGMSPKDIGTIMLTERTFQFWPESISDTIDIGWSFKDIPGMSHALAQWASNGGRTITFEVGFNRFMKPVDSKSTIESLLDPFDKTNPNSELLKDNRPHNVDVASEIRYLRAFCYPSFSSDNAEGYNIAYPPPIAMLCVPGHQLGDVLAEDVIYAVMTGCDVTYKLAFPDGTPRRATVSLTFRQVVQDPFNATVYRAGFEEAFVPDSVTGSKEDISQGGARPGNGLDGRSGGPV